jgi:hypothetical protein
MTTLARIRIFMVPACVALMLVIAACWYNLFWLPSQHRYLDDRNFRVLETVSEQIGLNINAFDKIMDNAANSGVTTGALGSYLKNVAPQLEKPEEGESKPVVGDDYGDPPKMAVAIDESKHYLYLAFRRGSTAGYAIRTDLDKMIDKLLPPPIRCPFDAVVVAQADGTVIYQKSLAGIVISRIDTLEDASGDLKPDKSDSQIKLDSLSRSTRLEQIKVAGARYRLYSQPLPVPFATANPQRKGTDLVATGAIPRPWVICGLVRADRFRSESQAISSTYLLWLFGGILLAVAAYPFLRLHVSSPTERLRAGDVVIVAISTCFAAATLTFILLFFVYQKGRVDRTAEDQMRRLAAAIDRSFGQEKNKAFNQLHDFYLEGVNRKSELRRALHIAEAHPGQSLQLNSDGRGCKPSWACRTNILSNTDSAVAPMLKSYPYLQYVSWSDYRGLQRVKWTTKATVTPFLNLNDSSIHYYSAIKRAMQNPGGPSPVPTHGVASQYSPNTGENITVFWDIMDSDGRPVSGKVDPKLAKSLFCATLVTKPISLFDSILPAGYQFAVIEPGGRVVFHSDHSRNLRENFLAETDQNQDIRSRLAMRDEGMLIANYMGRPHRIYIHPMSEERDDSWTLVIFRDLHQEETMNFEVLCLASIMFLFYAGTIAMVLLLAHWTRTGRMTGDWLWPDSGKSAAYQMVLAFQVVAALLLVLLVQCSSFAALVGAISVPALDVAVCMYVLRHQNRRETPPTRAVLASSFRWQRSYIGAVAALLLVAAILPCLSFFKVACDFEERLFIEQGQLRLVSDIEKRAQSQLSRYQGVDAGRYATELLATPELNSAPVYSFHEALGITISSEPEGKTTLRFISTPCTLFSGLGRQRCVELLLSWLLPAYNLTAADSAHLANAGTSDIWSWTTTPGPRGQDLVLTEHEPESTALIIASAWAPLTVPWTNLSCWLSAIAYFAVVVWMARLVLTRMFLLDLEERVEERKLLLEGCQKGCHIQFSRRSVLQKLVLVHLAQDKLANPNSRHIVRDLMKEGLVERKCGLLTIRDSRFAEFLQGVSRSGSVEQWERLQEGVHRDTLRTSLMVVGFGVAGFLIYTQGAVFNTWVTYMTGAAASVPAFLRLFDSFRRGSGAAV